MSSTARGWDRHAADYYVTPEAEVRLFLTKFMQDQKRTHEDLQNKRILDPCAWWDAKHDMSYQSALFWAGADDKKCLSLDIREDSGSKYKGDFLDYYTTWIDRETINNETPTRCWHTDAFDMVMSNPPFALAREFIERWLEFVKGGGYVIYLLRLNFLGSKARKEFFDGMMPKYIYVHHKRMSFSEDGKTDSIEYAHMVFQKGYTGKTSELQII